MLEQDLSSWELNKYNVAKDFNRAEVRFLVDTVNTAGVWFKVSGGTSEQNFYTWLPVEVAEAIGTMLLYSAQKWREDHGQ